MSVSLSYPNNNVNVGHYIRFFINAAKYGICVLNLHSRHIGRYHSFFCSKLIHIKSALGLDIIHLSTINTHSVRWEINPTPSPQKHCPLFLTKSPPLNLQIVQSPLFRQSPLYIGFPWTPLPKLNIYIYIKVFHLSPHLFF